MHRLRKRYEERRIQESAERKRKVESESVAVVVDVEEDDEAQEIEPQREEGKAAPQDEKWGNFKAF